ncbi:MAG: sigma-54-dependent Fis family transcriptional regulator [Nitrosomonadaceae bacterium]|nr:MAG: sigma-54-dependent Fis family transcriptional regulator [Nitrosomonadaceae bacterium]
MSKHKERTTRSADGGKSTIPVVLVVDDESDILELLELTLVRMGLDVERAMTVSDARHLLDSRHFDLCLTDMRLPDGEGLELVRHIVDHCTGLPVAVITAYGTTENAVAALKAGAFDYLAKPVSLEQLRSLVKSALNLLPLQAKTATGSRDGKRALLGESPPMQQLRAMIEKLARSQAPIYISGESGSGKELAARSIHENSTRRDKPFVPVNCGAIPENLMESEFFGYRKGAFTGADAERDGFFQAADGGTLFLDEVADLPLIMQVKLLRVIQEKRVRKIGSAQEENVDVRIISATHQKLSECVENGKFRQDLYYRLNVIELKMPALREISEDIPLIANSILARLCQTSGRSRCSFSPAALEALAHYAFPGNVRELENILERTLALCPDAEIERDGLQLAASVKEVSPDAPASPAAASGDGLPLQDYLDQLEKESIIEVLKKTKYNRTAAARLLGITVRSMRYRMERLGLNDGDD